MNLIADELRCTGIQRELRKLQQHVKEIEEKLLIAEKIQAQFKEEIKSLQQQESSINEAQLKQRLNELERN